PLFVGFLSEIIVVGRRLRSGLGDEAMVGDVSYRVNSKESPNPAKWSPIRPCIRLTEGIFYSRSARGDRGKPSAIGFDSDCVVQVSVLASVSHQMVVRALFIDDTSIQHHDAVNRFECADPMGRNDN